MNYHSMWITKGKIGVTGIGMGLMEHSHVTFGFLQEKI